MFYLKRILKVSLIISLLFLLQQCKLYQNPEGTKELAAKSLESSFTIPEYWETKQDSMELVENWYTTFNDSGLNKLVEEAIDTTNLTILYQLALIDQGMAESQLTKTRKNVQVGYNGDYTGYSDTKGTNDYNFAATGGISWEADLWGKIETGLLAADENLQADIYNYSYTRQSIGAKVANLYFQLGTINEGLKIADAFLNVNDTIVNILKIREEVGIIDMKEVYLTNAQLSSIRAIIEEYKNLKQVTTRNLEVVLGRYPENKLEVDWNVVKLDPISQISNPIDLINRRPDLKRQEAILRSQFYLTEQAKLAKYPSLVLSANLGFSTIGDLIFGTGGSLFGPIFNGGALDNKISIATAVQKQALMSYGMGILKAFNEVETAMSSEVYLIEQEKNIRAAIKELGDAYWLLVEQYGVGRVSAFEVLQIQMQWLLKELDLVNIQGNLYKTRVQLYLALGGNITKNN